MEWNAKDFRRAMGRFPTGVVVVTTEAEGETKAMTANAFMSGSLEPAMVVVSVARTAASHARLLAGERFGVSILTAAQEDVSNAFAGKAPEGFTPRFERKNDFPVVAEAAVQVVARRVHAHPCGDHSLFVGEVEALVVAESETLPLVFSGGRYAALAAA